MIDRPAGRGRKQESRDRFGDSTGVRAAFSCAAAVFVVLLGWRMAPAALAQSSLPPGVQLLSSNAEEARILIRTPRPLVERWGPGESVITVEGWRGVSHAGAPELPTVGFQLALPPGKRAELIVRVLSDSLMQGVRPRPAGRRELYGSREELPTGRTIREPDEALYAGEYPTWWARLTGEGGLRHLRVVGVEAAPYRWDPGEGGIRVADRLELVVRFVDSGEGKRTWSEEVLGDDGPMWGRIYRRTLLNGAAAMGWRRSPVRPASRWEKRAAGGPEVRLRVRETGLYRVPFDSLRALGWPEGVEIRRVAMVKRFFVEEDDQNPFRELPVPIRVRDLNGNGIFDAQEGYEPDDVIFFGQTIWEESDYGRVYEERHPLPRDRRYGRENVYYVTAGTEDGLRMEPAGRSHLGLPDLPPETSFLWTEHFEKDGIYMPAAALGSDGDRVGYGNLHLGVAAVRREHFLWTGGAAPTTSRDETGFRDKYPIAFDLPGFLSPVRLRLALQGITRLDFSSWTGSRVSFWFYRGPGDTLVVPWPEIRVPDREPVLSTLEAADLEAVPWRVGHNLLFLQMPDSASGAGLDWLEFTWRRDYSAWNNRVSWTTEALAGDREFRLSGFRAARDDSLLLFDLTDSVLTGAGTDVRGPRWYGVDPAQVGGTQQDRTLTLQLPLDGQPRVLQAVSVSALPMPAAMEPVSRVDLRIPEGAEEELLIVSAPEFLEGREGLQGLAELADQRRREGRSVRLVSVKDVYDWFEGGRAWPRAIRSYLRYLFRTRTVDPSFLLLVGDASDDFAHVLSSSAPNLVPTQTVFPHATSGWVWDLVASDEWFVDNLSGRGEELDFLPDMAVGRLPVGTAEELSAVVGKLVKYSQFSDQDLWRNRGLFVADDDFSNRIGFRGNYVFHGDTTTWRSDESIFRWASREAMRKIRVTAGFTDFTADSFFVGAYMDSVPGLQRCRDWSTGRCRLDGSRPRNYNVGPALPYFEEGGENRPEADNRWYGDKYLRPLLRETMGRGYLFVNYQGHANAHLMTHEYIFADQRFLGTPDPTLLRNADRPFFFMGYGCHLAEFSASDEGLPNRGDGIAERLLIQDQGRGAVAALASTGYEWVDDNHVLNMAMMDAWFVDPPPDPPADGPSRWLLGEIVQQAKVNMVGASPGNEDLQGPSATYTLLGDPSMPMESAPPRLRVELNGSEWNERMPVEAEAGSDTARIRVFLRDEVHLNSVTVRRDGQVVPDSLYKIEQDTTQAGWDRFLVLVYNPALVPAPETSWIEITGRDLNGQERLLRLPVTTAVRQMVRRGGLLSEIQSGGILEPGDSLVVIVTSPVDLGAERIGLLLDGRQPDRVEKIELEKRRWELRTTLPGVLGDDDHLLVSWILRSDASRAEWSVTFHGPGAGDLRLVQVYNFPNPFEQDTRVYYDLSRTAERAVLGIYTQSGRKIRELAGPARVNTNVIAWDGLDADGDPVANGLYFYKLEIRDRDGRSVSRIERLARVR